MLWKTGSLGIAAMVIGAGPLLASDWEIRAEESTLAVQGTQSGRSFDAAFTEFDADITFDPSALDAASVTVRIDPASFESGSSDRDNEVPKKDFFHVSEFPEAVFQSTSIAATGEGSYLADGTLTLKGVAVPVALPFTLAIKGDVARVTGSVDLQRLDFGIGKGYKRDKDIGHAVTVTVTVVADRKAAETPQS
ncbi:MAG: YceI family protein [Pseudomonadota bacterium]